MEVVLNDLGPVALPRIGKKESFYYSELYPHCGCDPTRDRWSLSFSPTTDSDLAFGADPFGDRAASEDPLIRMTPWPCARCNREPIDTVWRPLDGATAFDTEERICGACWLVEDDRGAGRGDTEDPRELQRLHDAWLAKEFFSQKKYNKVFGCPDCGTLTDSSHFARHRRLFCKQYGARHRRFHCKSRADGWALLWLPHGQGGRRSAAVQSNPC